MVIGRGNRGHVFVSEQTCGISSGILSGRIGASTVCYHFNTAAVCVLLITSLQADGNDPSPSVPSGLVSCVCFFISTASNHVRRLAVV